MLKLILHLNAQIILHINAQIMLHINAQINPTHKCSN